MAIGRAVQLIVDISGYVDYMQRNRSGTAAGILIDAGIGLKSAQAAG